VLVDLVEEPGLHLDGFPLGLALGRTRGDGLPEPHLLAGELIDPAVHADPR
jgi:hypothetical protein